MARVKEFDEEIVIGKALDLFWRKGYEATSVRDLTAEMGISSSSLYATFGDKHALYLKALAGYRARELAQVKGQLVAGMPAIPTLQQFFDGLIRMALVDDDRGGSFTLNAAVELGARDEAVAAQLRQHLDDLSDVLAVYLFEGQARGEIDDRFAPDDLAQYVLLNLYSLSTIVAFYPNAYQLLRLSGVILEVLKPH